MHPDVIEQLARERLRDLYREAEQQRLAREAVANGRQHGARAAVGDRLVRLGLRLAYPHHRGPLPARFTEE